MRTKREVVIRNMFTGLILSILLVNVTIPVVLGKNPGSGPIKITYEGYNVYRFEEFIRYTNGTGENYFYKVNVYAINTSQGIILIDSGTEEHAKQLAKRIYALFPKKDIIAVLLTHAHADHAGGGSYFMNKDIPVYIDANDYWIVKIGMNITSYPVEINEQFMYTPYSPNNYSTAHIYPEGAWINFIGTNLPVPSEVDGLGINISYTPGHTPGSVCINYTTVEEDTVLFTGDTTIPYFSDDIHKHDWTFKLDYWTLNQIASVYPEGWWLIYTQNASLTWIKYGFLPFNPVCIICPGHNLPYLDAVSYITHSIDEVSAVLLLNLP